MTPKTQRVWSLVRQQHGVISRQQLLSLGLTQDGIKHRLAIGRLHRLRRGVYSVGRPEVNDYGRWMAAVLACGDEAILSHSSAATLWRIGFEARNVIELSLPSPFQSATAGFEFTGGLRSTSSAMGLASTASRLRRRSRP
jgi:Transcriptional regulator, AbiEi antitoxin